MIFFNLKKGHLEKFSRCHCKCPLQHEKSTILFLLQHKGKSSFLAFTKQKKKKKIHKITYILVFSSKGSGNQKGPLAVWQRDIGKCDPQHGHGKCGKKWQGAKRTQQKWQWLSLDMFTYKKKLWNWTKSIYFFPLMKLKKQQKVARTDGLCPCNRCLPKENWKLLKTGKKKKCWVETDYERHVDKINSGQRQIFILFILFNIYKFIYFLIKKFAKFVIYI